MILPLGCAIFAMAVTTPPAMGVPVRTRTPPQLALAAAGVAPALPGPG
jgi:hypothetical protein